MVDADFLTGLSKRLAPVVRLALETTATERELGAQLPLFERGATIDGWDSEDMAGDGGEVSFPEVSRHRMR